MGAKLVVNRMNRAPARLSSPSRLFPCRRMFCLARFANEKVLGLISFPHASQQIAPLLSRLPAKRSEHYNAH
jgi:hypothetical protein